MQEITILSGKGGTGKTSITAAIASIVKNAVFCDNDVDAADLHLILQPQIKEKHAFSSGKEAIIDTELCTACGICEDYCRFDAIQYIDETYIIKSFQCEGCRLCERVCPYDAIKTIEKKNNFWFVSNTRFGTLIHAHMGPGEENSGRLVTQVRNKAKEIAQQSHANYIINDGPPGIGCSAIASITGTDKTLLVIEPSISSLHDALRIIELINNFNTPIYALINKYDINTKISDQIEDKLKEKKIPLLGKIPFDKQMVKAMIEGKSIIEYLPDSEISLHIKKMWEGLK